MRKVVYIPTVHSPAEMHNPAFFGALLANSRFDLHGAVWRNIIANIPPLGEDLTGIKLYYESISTSSPQSTTITPLSETLPLVATAAEKQSELFYALGKAGARIMPTEDRAIFDDMLRASQTQIDILNAIRSHRIDPAVGISQIGTLNRFVSIYMQLRDQSIARNIDQSLGDGERGILVLGMGHDVKRYLPPDIDFKFLTPILEARWEVDHEPRLGTMDTLQLPEGHQPLLERF